MAVRKSGLIAGGLFLMMGCLPDGNIKSRHVDYRPEALGDGWEVADVNEGITNAELFRDVAEEVYSEEKFLFIRSLLVVHKGKLAAEMYPKDNTDRDRPHQVWSVTKSFVSLIVGIAIQQGHIKKTSESIFNYLPEYRSRASSRQLSISIDDCLTMRTGIAYDNEGRHEEELLAQVPDDLTGYILDLPMNVQPGTETTYKNSDPQLLVKVVSNATNSDFVKYANENLFSPLNIGGFYWSRNRDGTPYGGFGLWLTPRDLAKVGKLFLQQGQWEGRQVVSSEWISESRSHKTQIDGHDYGYLIWADVAKGRYWFWGRGGQYLFMIPDREILIVITSDQFADGDGTSINDANNLVDRILSSLSNG